MAVAAPFNLQQKLASGWWGAQPPTLAPAAVNIPKRYFTPILRQRIQNAANQQLNMTRSAVYLWVCGNEKYVGETGNFEERSYQHISHAFSGRVGASTSSVCISTHLNCS